MAFIFPDEKKERSGQKQIMRPNSFKKLHHSSIRSSLNSMLPLMDIPEAGVATEPLSLNLDQGYKKQKVQLLEVRDCNYETTEDDSSQDYQYLDMKDRASCQFRATARVARSHTIGRTTTSEQHQRFHDSGISNTRDVKEGKKIRLDRSASSTVIKSPIDENGNAVPFQRPLPMQWYCDKFLGSWHKQLGKGQVRRILRTGEVLDCHGRRKYIVKFLSPLKFGIPQGSGRSIIATLKQDGLYLQLDNGEIWVKKEHMFAFSMHRVDTTKCCIIS